MIDIETELFDLIDEQAKEKFPELFLTGEYVKSPSEFPCVSVVEIDNTADSATATTDDGENHALLTYEVNIYSNRRTGKKSECRKIGAFIDGIFGSLNFTRTMLEPVPNLQDATIYRLLGRYEAEADKYGNLYRTNRR